MDELQGHYFVDTNLLRLASQGVDPELESWFIRLFSRPESKAIATHFSRMEALGVSLKGQPKPSYSIIDRDLQSRDFKKIFSEIRSTAHQLYSGLDVLSENFLKARLEELEKRTSRPFKDSGLYEKHFHIPGDRISDFRNDLIDLLSVQYLHSFHFKEDIRAEAHDFLLMGAIAEDIEGRNISLFRSFKSVWDFRNKSREHERYEPAKIAEFEEAMRVKQFRDFVDFELIQFSLLGYQEGKMPRPVVCVTADPVQTLTNKVMIYKGMLQVVRKRFEPIFAQQKFLIEKYGPILVYKKGAGKDQHIIATEMVPAF